MALPFDSPGHLERRIAAQMAADQSDDSSFGVSRKAASMASVSFSTGDESYLRGGLGHSQSVRQATGNRDARVDVSSSASVSRSGVLSPRNVNISVARPTLADALAASGKSSSDQKSSLASTSRTSMDAESDTRVRSPPLTSTPHPAQIYKSRRTSFHHDAGASKSALSQHGITDTLSLSFASAKDQSRPNAASTGLDIPHSQGPRASSVTSQFQESVDRSQLDPLRESDLPAETSSYFRSKVLGERFEASMAGDESLSEAIIQRRRSQSPRSSESAGRDQTAASAKQTASNESIEASSDGVPHTEIAARGAIDTPKAARMSDKERMKAYVLSSVKAANPLRQAQLRHMTPRVRDGKYITADNNTVAGAATLSRRHTFAEEEQSLDADQISVAPSAVSEVSSTNDLTVPAKFATRANTSLPGVEEVEMGTAGNARVDPKRLQHLLHKINAQLESEVADLRSENQTLQAQYDRALLDCERLRKQSSQRSTTPVNDPPMPDMAALQKEMDQMQEANAALAPRDGGSRMRTLAAQVNDLQRDLLTERESRAEDEELYRIEVQAILDDRDRLKRQLEDDRAAARAEIERIRSAQENQTANGDTTAALREDVEHFQQVIAELRESNAQLAKYEVNYEALQVDYRELDDEFRQYQADAERVFDEVSEYKDKVSDLEIALSERENEILKLEFKLSNQSDTMDLRRAKEQIAMLETTLAMTRETAAKEARRIVETSLASVSNGRAGSTPLHPTIAALRKPIDTPRSPPAVELSSASWMQTQDTLGEGAIRRDLSDVRHDLEDARREVDERISQLGEQGLFKKLVDAQERIARLEADLQRERSRHGRMSGNADRSAQHRSRSSLVRSTASAREQDNVVQAVSDQLEELKREWAKDRELLEAERKDLEAEKEGVRRTQRDLDARRAETKERARRQQADTLAELSRTRRLVSALERGVQDDIAAYEACQGKDESANKELDLLAFDLQRTKVRVEEIDKEFNAKRATFERLEHEMQERSHVDESLALHVHGLHQDMTRFSNEMQRLREERSSLFNERQTLFARRAQSQQHRISAQEDLRTAREALLAHQRQLDEQVDTIEMLHAQVAQQTKEMGGMQADRDRLHEQRREILVDVAQLEADLRRVRDESKRFGADLDGLQRVKGLHAEMVKQSVSAAGVMTADVIEMVKDQAQREEKSMERHRAECRGLLLQIRYEKARYMRESDLRQDMIHQKRYLLGIVGGLRMSETATAKFLADLRLSRAGAEPRSYNNNIKPIQRLRAAVRAVMAICRAKRMADNWRSAIEVKRALRRAHADAKGSAQATTVHQKTARERGSS